MNVVINRESKCMSPIEKKANTFFCFTKRSLTTERSLTVLIIAFTLILQLTGAQRRVSPRLLFPSKMNHSIFQCELLLHGGSYEPLFL